MPWATAPADIEDYFERLYRYDKFAGGFVWEWCDHAVWMGRTPDGRDRYGYGGDFGEFPHDGNFCMDGLVLSRPHAAHRPARVEECRPPRGAPA